MELLIPFIKKGSFMLEYIAVGLQVCSYYPIPFFFTLVVYYVLFLCGCVGNLIVLMVCVSYTGTCK